MQQKIVCGYCFKLNTELSALQEQEYDSDVSMHEVIKNVIKLSELLNDLYFYYKKADSPEKKKSYEKSFPNFSFLKMACCISVKTVYKS